ncbi:hypothetical protein L228DRAFT_57478 [Xylona heveae TC161]|uniref:Uncharacterized protein n=1 Tax=Xylona heveae (strain CBS 132557 / TC161) TaxID=1328760 RepID=A0A165IGL8_XYLHT|nr:hypothetical protein L228DRAFT_57478 [Xylona heveae TC161]KZF24865.1 hypothetical protein L228DRAFT_57478 [Xylona heveae TC161]
MSLDDFPRCSFPDDHFCAFQVYIWLPAFLPWLLPELLALTSLLLIQQIQVLTTYLQRPVFPLKPAYSCCWFSSWEPRFIKFHVHSPDPQLILLTERHWPSFSRRRTSIRPYSTNRNIENSPHGLVLKSRSAYKRKNHHAKWTVSRIAPSLIPKQ